MPKLRLMRECYSAALEQSQKELDDLVTTVLEEMRDYSGVKESEEFTSLNNEWSIWADKLCSNQRKLFGLGSIAGINYITCKTQLINSQLKLYRSIYIDSMNAE